MDCCSSDFGALVLLLTGSVRLPLLVCLLMQTNKQCTMDARKNFLMQNFLPKAVLILPLRTNTFVKYGPLLVKPIDA